MHGGLHRIAGGRVRYSPADGRGYRIGDRERRRWSESRKEPYVSAEWLYDASENTISWIFYNDDGTVKETGQVP